MLQSTNPPITNDPAKAEALITSLEITENTTAPAIEDYIPTSSWKNVTSQPVNSCFNELFAQQALEHPDAQAVNAPDGKYTYRELDEASSALAHEFRRRGVGADVLVPLLFEKSKFVVLAMHAVIKAGGAFNLWDPTLPPARMEGMFVDSGAMLIACSPATAQLARIISDSIIVVDETSVVSSLTSLLPQDHGPKDALYAVFTSGSTGKPKGFLMEHNALCTCALAFGRILGLTGASRCLQFSSNSFDLATFEHLIPFLFGSCLVILSEEERKGDLTHILDARGITHAMLTPSMSRLLEPDQLPTLQGVLLCGEIVTAEDVRRWTPHLQLHDGYSPAEAGCINIVNSAMVDTQPNNIGYSTGVIPWVVDPDDHDKLLPVGETGELIIQGHTVGRGYFGPREKSQAAFIDPPSWIERFNCSSYGRLYKTGDLVRYEPADGSMQFLGRKDSQVKLHGQRLELGEVQHQLQRHFPPPHAIVVDLVAAENRDPRLVGFVSRVQDRLRLVDGSEEDKDADIFVVPGEEFCLKSQAVLEALRGVLPSYMVPSDLLLLDYLLVLPSGKTDTRSLRIAAAGLSPEEVRKYSSVLGQARDSRPSTYLEEDLLQLWASALKLSPDQIGVEDNVFGLGASSLDAIRVGGSARKLNLGFADLSSAVFFKHPTIRGMAAALSSMPKLRQTAPSTELTTFQLESSVTSELLEKGGLRVEDLEDCGFLPVTPFQGKSTALKCMHITLDITGIDHARLEAAWEIVQQRHISLRSIYLADSKGDIYQAFLRYAKGTTVVLRCEQPVSGFATSFCDQDAEPVMDGRPWWNLTRIDNQTESLLVIRTTHAQFDAMTLTVIFQDLMAAYEDRLSQRQLQLALPDYMHFRLNHNRSPAMIDFWKTYLESSQLTQPTLLDPSTAPPTGENSMVFAFQQIPPLTPPSGITLACMFRAAWAATLAHYTQQNDLVFGEFVEGRAVQLPDAGSITGCTSAETPIRITITPDMAIRDLLAHSQEQYIARIPFETCDIKDIIPQSTTWPSDTAFNHILVVEEPNAIPPIVLDGRSCPHKWAFHGRLEDVHVLLIPGSEGLSVGITGPEVRVSRGIADLLVGRLAAMLRAFDAGVDGLVSEILL